MLKMTLEIWNNLHSAIRTWIVISTCGVVLMYGVMFCM